eukprot:11086227-Karenia_brevis.AAC.1
MSTGQRVNTFSAATRRGREESQQTRRMKERGATPPSEERVKLSAVKREQSLPWERKGIHM